MFSPTALTRPANAAARRFAMLIAAVGSVGGAAGAAPELAARPPLAIVEAHVAAGNAHDVEGILATLADEVEFSYFLPDDPRALTKTVGRTDQRQNFATAIRLNPAANFRIVSTVVSDDMVITRECGTALTETRDVEQCVVNLYRVESGRIRSIWLVRLEPSTQTRPKSAAKSAQGGHGEPH